jgi:hypothetical protein
MAKAFVTLKKPERFSRSGFVLDGLVADVALRRLGHRSAMSATLVADRKVT